MGELYSLLTKEAVDSIVKRKGGGDDADGNQEAKDVSGEGFLSFFR